MKARDWLVSGDGNYELCKSVRPWDLLQDNYRLYRFLTEVEDALNGLEDEYIKLPEIRKLVILLQNLVRIHNQHLMV